VRLPLRIFKCWSCGKVLFQFCGKIGILIVCSCGAENRAGIGPKEEPMNPHKVANQEPNRKPNLLNEQGTQEEEDAKT